MKIKSITALLAASFLLTACGNLSETSGTDMVGETISSINSTSTSSITNITANENFVSKTEIKTSENEYFPTTYECIPQCAPSMSIIFAIPDGWSYETVQTNDAPTSSISVYLKPNAEADGHITLEYIKDGIGFCGTGLHQESIDFNGYSAVKGVYDGSDKWDFILLNDEFEGCAVLNNANEWYDKYADEIEYILSTVEFRKFETSEPHDSIMKYEAWSVRPQCTPSFGVDFELPYDWSYETVQTDDDPTSSISVCLKPDAEADGSIIFEYTKDGIEVSDSALSEIETEFNGYPATEGTYLCSEQWDHIFLKGDYEGCAVLNNANDWYDKYADEIEYILSTVEFRKYD